MRPAANMCIVCWWFCLLICKILCLLCLCNRIQLTGVLYLVSWPLSRDDPDAKAAVGSQGNRNTSAFEEYVISLYWAAATMTSTGYGDVSAHSTIGRTIALAFMLIGLLLYGYCLSSIAATLANADAPRYKVLYITGHIVLLSVSPVLSVYLSLSLSLCCLYMSHSMSLSASLTMSLYFYV